jgi:multiple sugar transport system permease protein
MERVKSPFGRAVIYLALTLFAIYSLLPFLWTLLQSFKTLKDANSRTPKFIFTPTLENYQELWLRSTPENGAAPARTGLSSSHAARFTPTW